MLSRSNSTASNHLHRSKSVTSVHTLSTTGQHSTLADLKEQAEVAAAEAYMRAQHNQQFAAVTNPQNRLNRKRSQGRKSAEGSHFEAARLGRRKSAALRDTGRRKDVGSSSVVKTITTSSLAIDDSTVTSSRPATTHAAYHDPERSWTRASQPVRSVNRRSSTTVHGSPTPRQRQTSRNHNLNDSPLAHAAEYYPSSSTPRLQKEAERPVTVHSRRPSIRENQTDEDILAIARDQCLQDFKQNSLRERKSFFGSHNLKKWRTNTAQPFVPDSTLPPFNCADDAYVMLNTMLDEDPVQQAPEVSNTGSQSGFFSGSVKDRIRNMLRKTSRSTSGIPPQQIKARQQHGSLDSEAIQDTQPTHNRTLQFSIHASAKDRSRMISSASEAVDGSRVTSWTDSTVTHIDTTVDALNERAQSTAPMGEASTRSRGLRSKASYLGRSAQNKLRKISHKDLRASSESQGLFAALQGLIHPNRQQDESHRQASSSTGVSRVDSAVVMDTSEKQYQSNTFEPPGSHSSTIRTVTPESLHNFRAMSPLIEAASPSEISPHLQRMTRPSPEMISQRVLRSKERWRQALNNDQRLLEDNPYELPSMPRTGWQTTETKRQADDEERRALQAMTISPSVYSRATDSATPQKSMPDKPITTLVKVTGREVQRYVVSPHKSDQQEDKHQEPSMQVSSEWRKWLTGELRGFSASSIMQAIPSASAPVRRSPNGIGRNKSDTAQSLTSAMVETSEATSSKDDLASSQQPSSESVTPPTQMDLRQVQRRRPRATTRRRSSFMNDRYPMVETSRASSRQSAQSRNKSRITSSHSEQDGSVFSSELDKHVSAPSITNDESSSKIKVSDGNTSDDTTLIKSDLQPSEASRPTTATKRAQSNVELRARFRTNASGTSRPLDIQRRSAGIAHSLLSDGDVQSITAGPYANPQKQAVLRQENTPPPSHERLPAMSSSQWLARPAIKTSLSDTIRQQLDGTNMQNKQNAVSIIKRSSPGQRFATGWLESRELRSPDGSATFL